MTPPIAVVGMACCYPDARSPAELWENVLSKRRAFRRMPPQRLRLLDYAPRDPADPDSTYLTHAALLEGYDFDRVRFRVGARAFRSTDMAHWLALDMADRALADAGFSDAGSLPREATGVIVGNTLTGELSRATGLRLRFPYVRRVADAVLAETGVDVGDRAGFLERLEACFKAPFPPPDEDTLAGGLSNTIAGRICNHFDLHGGCYTVDGACASSLLAVSSACSALVSGDLDVALAGGVDLSLDPFELVGFARVGALAREMMRVYDARSAGFWPGEGAGFAVLMRYEDALATGRRVYALVRGWGISSDGSGGITRPEPEGQMRAIRRAYARAGFGIDTVGYFEGHGTGTAVGDATELAVLSAARREAGAHAPAAAVGSIKANIGHTKAAAGIAGMIKATLALHAQVLPPATGCESPHRELTAPGAPLRVLQDAEPWPRDRPLRAAVSAMGFGGVNVHVALEGVAPVLRTGLTAIERTLVATQDAEVFLLGAASAGELRASIGELSSIARRISLAELGDLAAALARGVAQRPAVRAAVVARSPDELASRLATLSARLSEGAASGIDPDAGIFAGAGQAAPRIAFLFPGQGAPVHDRGGALERRFSPVRRLYDENPLPDGGDRSSTAFAQPAIALASLAALSTLDHLGIAADVAVGHSLGELLALHWAGVMDRQALLRVVRARGAAMAEHGMPHGAMAALKAGALEVKPLLCIEGAVIAGYNAPDQTVVSGEARAVADVVSRARARGIAAVSLRVSHAFHFPLVAPAAPVFAGVLARERFGRVERCVISTVTGAVLAADCDLPALLTDQITSPVRFVEAARHAAERADLFIEVGPGNALAALASGMARVPAVAIDAGGPSLAGLLSVTAAAFALGAPLDRAALFAGRLIRPFDPGRPLRFLTSPCEDAPLLDAGPPLAAARRKQASPPDEAPVTPADSVSKPALEIVSQVVAERTELPREALRPDARLLGDLHLSSITVGGIVAEVAKRLGLSPSRAPTEYADSTLAELATALDEARSGVQSAEPDMVAGVDGWVRPFVIDWVERPLAPHRTAPPGLRVLAPDGDPLGAALREAFGNPAGPGVVVCLPQAMDRAAVASLLEAARLRCDTGPFVVVSRGAGAAFARTLHLEQPRVPVAAVQVPEGDPRAVAWVLAEAAAATQFHEAHYDACGVRRVPVLRLLPLPAVLGQMPLGRGDVVLVTGGGKGISAECALALAQETGARLLVVGRSSPAADRELATNLDRFAAAGVEVRYVAADVTDAAGVRGAIHEAAAALGPVTAVLHGAGSNTPALIGSLDEDAFLHTLAVKARGLQNVLAAVEPARLRVLIAFSSIIGRAGMRGEADYAVANEELTVLVERFAREAPTCRCLSIEWSVWSGAGMGERLGRLEALLRRGITPISVDEGAAMLSRLLRAPDVPVAVVVTGRFGELPTIELPAVELPLRRFLERPRVHVPGVELVADSELSALSDPYLADHVISGQPVLPAVIGLEAMAQVASALVNATAPPVFEAVRFSGPVIVPAGEKVRLRVAALAQGDGRVAVVLRSEATGFAVNHFKATCRFGEPPVERPSRLDARLLDDHIHIDPAEELYGTILFHRGRFRRLRGYRRLLARECLAELGAPPAAQEWFGRFLPPDLILGDPGARDTALHAIQVCVPQATLLPVAVEQLVPVAPGIPAFIHATERSRDGDTFVYDVAVADAGGAVLERWTGLRLQLVRGEPAPRVWPEPLLGPYLERRVRDLVATGEISVAVGVDVEQARPARSDRTLRHAVGPGVAIQRRPDGRPEVSSPDWLHVSVAHAGDLTLAVAGARRVACDVEPVVSRPPSVWRELLGADRFRVAELVAREAAEELDVAATRVWTVYESARKAGAAPDVPFLFAGAAAGGWVVLESGQLAAACTVVTARRTGRRLAITVIVEGRRAGV